MYRLNDKAAAIREIQRFILLISDRSEYKIPRVSIDGIYGEQTENAVRSFQELSGYEATGRVDNKTFDSLYSLYSAILAEEEISSTMLEKDIFPLKAGMMGDTVNTLNVILAGLKETYFDITTVRKDAYFSKETESAISDMQKIFNVKQTGIVDAQLYQRLHKELRTQRGKI